MFRLNQMLSGENRLSSASAILISTLALSNILGWVRLHYLAQKIPADILDTYVAAFRLPDLVFNLIVLGAISSAFIPVFSDYLAKNKKQEAWHIAQSIITLLFIVLLILVIPLYFLMPYVMPLLVPYFDATKVQIVIDLSRIFLLSPIIFGLSYVLGGILNSFNRFVAYSLAPLFYNISIIAGTILLADRFSVYGVAWSVIVGALLHLSVQLIPAIRLGFKLRPLVDLTHQAVRKIGFLMIPRILGMAANQIMLIVFTAFASIAAGANFIFDSMNNIQTMPTVIFGTSFATAVFPLLARHAALGRKDLYINDIVTMARWIIFLLIPASLGMFLLRAQIVRLVLGSGYFGWDETIRAATTLGFFALSLVFSGLIPLLARAFYAMKDTTTPMLLSSISAAVSIAAGYILVKLNIFDVAPSLALAFSLGAFLNAALLYLAMGRRLGRSLNGEVVLFSGRVLLATFIMGLAVQGMKYWVGTVFDLDRAVWLVLQTVAAGATGLIVFWGVATLLRIPEASNFPKAIWKKYATLPS